jgi:hypothetical protein
MVRRLRAARPGGRALGGRTAGPTPRPPGARGGVQPAHRHDLGPEGREGRPDATTFAENLPETAAELYVTDAAADLAKADRLPRSSIDAEFYGLVADCRVARTGCGRHGYGATTSWPYGAKCFGSSPTRHRRRGPARTQGLPRLRAGPRGRRRPHRRARSGGHLLRRHPRLPGRDRAEHRPGAPPEPGAPSWPASGGESGSTTRHPSVEQGLGDALDGAWPSPQFAHLRTDNPI